MFYSYYIQGLLRQPSASAARDYLGVGLGTGDVVGPASSISGNIATFADPSGDVLADSGVSALLVPSTDQKNALSGTDGTPSGVNPYVTDSDPRLSDSRSPTAHASSHQNGGSDEISVAGLSGLLADAQNPRVKQTEVDFGAVMQVNSQTFTITDAEVTPSSRINCWLSGDAPTGRDADDMIAEDPLKFIVVPSAGTFALYIEQPNGALNNTYKIDYTL